MLVACPGSGRVHGKQWLGSREETEGTTGAIDGNLDEHHVRFGSGLAATPHTGKTPLLERSLEDEKILCKLVLQQEKEVERRWLYDRGKVLELLGGVTRGQKLKNTI